MLSPDQLRDKLLHKEGHSIRHIAKLTGLSRNAIRQVLRKKAPLPFQIPERPSKLPSVQRTLFARGRSAVRLLEEMKAQGFTCSIIVLRRFLRTLKAGTAAQKKATVRFETAPGQA